MPHPNIHIPLETREQVMEKTPYYRQHVFSTGRLLEGLHPIDVKFLTLLLPEERVELFTQCKGLMVKLGSKDPIHTHWRIVQTADLIDEWFAGDFKKPKAPKEVAKEPSPAKLPQPGEGTSEFDNMDIKTASMDDLLLAASAYQASGNAVEEKLKASLVSRETDEKARAEDFENFCRLLNAEPDPQKKIVLATGYQFNPALLKPVNSPEDDGASVEADPSLKGNGKAQTAILSQFENDNRPGAEYRPKYSSENRSESSVKDSSAELRSNPTARTITEIADDPIESFSDDGFDSTSDSGEVLDLVLPGQGHQTAPASSPQIESLPEADTIESCVSVTKMLRENEPEHDCVSSRQDTPEVAMESTRTSLLSPILESSDELSSDVNPVDLDQATITGEQSDPTAIRMSGHDETVGSYEDIAGASLEGSTEVPLSDGSFSYLAPYLPVNADTVQTDSSPGPLPLVLGLPDPFISSAELDHLLYPGGQDTAPAIAANEMVGDNHGTPVTHIPTETSTVDELGFTLEDWSRHIHGTAIKMLLPAPGQDPFVYRGPYPLPVPQDSRESTVLGFLWDIGDYLAGVFVFCIVIAIVKPSMRAPQELYLVVGSALAVLYVVLRLLQQHFTRKRINSRVVGQIEQPGYVRMLKAGLIMLCVVVMGIVAYNTGSLSKMHVPPPTIVFTEPPLPWPVTIETCPYPNPIIPTTTCVAGVTPTVDGSQPSTNFGLLGDTSGNTEDTGPGEESNRMDDGLSTDRSGTANTTDSYGSTNAVAVFHLGELLNGPWGGFIIGGVLSYLMGYLHHALRPLW